jgi:hypothetical protein
VHGPQDATTFQDTGAIWHSYTPDMTDGSADRNSRTPAQVIREYLALRREWDLATWERVSGIKRGKPIDPAPRDFDWDAANAAWSELHCLRQQWCTPEAVERLHPRASFGSSSEFNADLEVLDVRHASDGEGDASYPRVPIRCRWHQIAYGIRIRRSTHRQRVALGRQIIGGYSRPSLVTLANAGRSRCYVAERPGERDEGRMIDR